MDSKELERIGFSREDIKPLHHKALLTAFENGKRDVPALLAEVDRLTEARLAFSDRLGFGDGKTEPAATLEQMLDPIEQAFSDAHEHAECPVVCEPCGETLASTTCEHCHGSGCGPGTASGAYSECEWCAGAGRVHVGCAEQSYADLATRAERAEADLAALRAGVGVLADEWDLTVMWVAVSLRALLSDATTGESEDDWHKAVALDMAQRWDN